MRRDNCLLVKDVITTSLEMMLIHKDVDGAVAYVKSTISNLLMNRIDLSLRVISKVGRGVRGGGTACRAATGCLLQQRTALGSEGLD